MAKSDEIQTASIADFKARYEQGVQVKLPASGLVVRLRSVGLDLMLKRGKVPNILMPYVAKALQVFDEGAPQPQPPTSEESASAFVELMDDVCREAFIEPPIKGGPQGEKGLEVDWLEREDKQFVFNLLNVPLATLADHSFRNESESAVEPVYAEQEHEPESI